MITLVDLDTRPPVIQSSINDSGRVMDLVVPPTLELAESCESTFVNFL